MTEEEEIVKKEIKSLEDFDVGNGALIATDPNTGEIISAALKAARDRSQELA